MSEHPVADLRAARDLAASRSAVRQYERAARLHEAAANDLMTRGWFAWAGESLILADRLTLAAKIERLP
jgi:hypothetical protein